MRVYHSKPLLLRPGELLRQIGTDLPNGMTLARALFIRDLKALYRQSYLGYLWALLPPLVASASFIFLNAQGIVVVDTKSVPYPAFVLVGTLVWQSFVDAIVSPSQQIASARPMLSKLNFQREAILVAGIYMVLFNFCIRLVLVVSVLLVWDIRPTETLMLFPPAMGLIILLGFTIGLLLAPLAMLYGDVARLISVVMPLWMLLTPVVYPVSDNGFARALSIWNPVSPLISMVRASLSGHHPGLGQEFCIILLFTTALLMVGLLGFRIAMPHMIARMGS